MSRDQIRPKVIPAFLPSLTPPLPQVVLSRILTCTIRYGMVPFPPLWMCAGPARYN